MTIFSSGINDNQDGGTFTALPSGISTTFFLLGGRYTFGAGGTVTLLLVPGGGNATQDVSNGGPGTGSNPNPMILDLAAGQYEFDVSNALPINGYLARVPYRAA